MQRYQEFYKTILALYYIYFIKLYLHYSITGTMQML